MPCHSFILSMTVWHMIIAPFAFLNIHNIVLTIFIIFIAALSLTETWKRKTETKYVLLWNLNRVIVRLAQFVTVEALNTSHAHSNYNNCIFIFKLLCFFFIYLQHNPPSVRHTKYSFYSFYSVYGALKLDALLSLTSVCSCNCDEQTIHIGNIHYQIDKCIVYDFIFTRIALEHFEQMWMAREGNVQLDLAMRLQWPAYFLSARALFIIYISFVTLVSRQSCKWIRTDTCHWSNAVTTMN